MSKAIKKKTEDQSAKIVRFLRGVMLQANSPIERLELRQKTVNGTSRVRVWSKESFDPEGKGFDFDYATEVILDDLHADASSMRGYVQYWLFAYAADDDAEPQARVALSVGQREFGTTVEETEEPNEKGIAAQAMRHTEALMRMTIQSSLDVQNQYRRILESVSRDNEKMAEGYFKMITLVEELTSAKAERELLVKESERKIERQKMVDERLLRKLDMLMPILGARVVKAFAGDDATKVSAELKVLGEDKIRQFLKSVKQEQLEKLMMTLEPTQIALLGELWQDFAREEPSEKSAEKSGEKEVEQ